MPPPFELLNFLSPMNTLTGILLFTLLRAIFDVAMSNYLNRFLNVPCVALPSEKEEPINNRDSESNRGNMMDRFLDTLDKRHQVNEAAKMVATCLSTQQG